MLRACFDTKQQQTRGALINEIFRLVAGSPCGIINSMPAACDQCGRATPPQSTARGLWHGLATWK